MARKFAEKYGLDKDRKKPEVGQKFEITKIVSIQKTRQEGEDYEVVQFDAIDSNGALLKFYHTGSAIVDQCKTMQADAKPDGTLKESLEVEVVEKISEKRKKPYLSFE